MQSSLVNLDDPRQDVLRNRPERSQLNRFRVAEAMIRALPSSMSVLEVGGGAAEFSRIIRNLGHSVTFVDLSSLNVDRARSLGFEAHTLDLNSGLPIFTDAKFDLIVMLEIIEHVVAAEALLRECRRVLRPGGSLLLSTPNFAYWANRARILLGNLSQDEGYHFRFFTPSILARRLRDAGFAPIACHHTAPAVGWNFVVNRLLGRPRLHIHVPRALAPLFAHTLIVRAEAV